MGKLLALAFVVLGVWAAACSASKDAPPHARSTSALYGGTVTPDASQVGVVYLEWVENQNDIGNCSSGTGG